MNIRRSPSVFIFFVKQAGNPPIQPRLNQFEIMNPSCCLQFYPSGLSLLPTRQHKFVCSTYLARVKSSEITSPEAWFIFVTVAMTSLRRTFREKFRWWCKWKFRPSERSQRDPRISRPSPAYNSSFFFYASRATTNDDGESVCWCMRGCNKKGWKFSGSNWSFSWRMRVMLEKQQSRQTLTVYTENDLLEKLKMREKPVTVCVLVREARVKSIFRSCAATLHATIFPTTVREIFHPSNTFNATMVLKNSFPQNSGEKREP